MENNRKPILTVIMHPDVYEDGKPIEQDAETIENGVHLNVHFIDMTDAENGIDYKDVMGKLVHADKEEVKLMRIAFRYVLCEKYWYGQSYRCTCKINFPQ